MLGVGLRLLQLFISQRIRTELIMHLDQSLPSLVMRMAGTLCLIADEARISRQIHHVHAARCRLCLVMPGSVCWWICLRTGYFRRPYISQRICTELTMHLNQSLPSLAWGRGISGDPISSGIKWDCNSIKEPRCGCWDKETVFWWWVEHFHFLPNIPKGPPVTVWRVLFNRYRYSCMMMQCWFMDLHLYFKKIDIFFWTLWKKVFLIFFVFS